LPYPALSGDLVGGPALGHRNGRAGGVLPGADHVAGGL